MEIIGNVSILKKHLEDQGLEVVLDKKTIGEEVNFNEYNFIFIGSGTEKNLDVVSSDSSNDEETGTFDKQNITTGSGRNLISNNVFIHYII